MTDIIKDFGTKNVQEKTRSSKAIINNPENGDRTIIFKNEVVTLIDGIPEGAPKSIAPTVRVINDVAAETITFTDPVTQQEITLFAGTIAAAIQEFYVKWTEEDHNPDEEDV